MALRPGYRQTGDGMIPKGWVFRPLECFSAFITKGATPTTYGFNWERDGILFLRSECVSEDGLDLAQSMYISPAAHSALERGEVRSGDLLMTITGNVGRVVLLDEGFGVANTNQHIARIRIKDTNVDSAYVFHYLSQPEVRRYYNSITTGQAYPQISLEQVRKTRVPLPPLTEQRAIAAALSDVDALITSLDRLIAKKRDVKLAAMQQLLTGKTRLPGFSGEWEVKKLADITECLDSLRVPLNDIQRAKIPGDYPYCGANGVLDYVSNYIIDDDIILIAEDGGYFDEYAYRPIAYRMTGKCWVNNHAHVLKALEGVHQDFVFFSLVHKNILRFLASGTRAKLNRSELDKIEIVLPHLWEEQRAIAAVLSDMDAEIATLERRRDKTRALKQGMMQELLTGRLRLV